MNRLETIARGLIKPLNPYASSLLGMLTMTWGLWIINPFWNVFDTAPVYNEALGFAPEVYWGAWATLCGIIILLSLYFSNAIWLARATGFAIWHWSTVSGMLWWGDWHNTAGLTYMFIAMYSTFIYLNIKINYVNQGIKHF